ncbi:MAG TPA: DUF2782 domain-containing protein [Rhodanobacteraceae bacterium]
MKFLAVCSLLAGTALLLPLVARAQSVSAQALTVLPPPSIDAPGAKPVVPLKTALPPKPLTFPAASGTAIPIPALPSLYGNPSRDGRGDLPPTVKVSKHDGQVIEEYYEGGQLYMVQVHPKHGVTYTYFVDKGHNLIRSPGAPKISPALFTILTWGKPDASH